MKTCKKCNIPKELNQFSKCKKYKDKLNTKCKLCMIEYNKLHKCNPIKDKQQRENYKEIDKIKHKEWYLKNKENILIESKIKYLNNREEIIKKNTIHSKNYTKNRRKNDLEFKLLHYLRSRIWSACFKNNKNKQDKSINLLGCSIKQYKQHLESQFKPEMNWENYGKIWEIDHIIPCDIFDFSLLEEQQKCFHYTNTQPLFKTENRQKYNKINQINNE